MRLKTYTAQTMQEAMDKIRLDMGDEAIIVSVDQGKGMSGVRVTAAVEARHESTVAPAARHEPAANPFRFGAAPSFDRADVRAVLTHHGLPVELAARLEDAALAIDAVTLTDALASALETVMSFAAVPPTPNKVIALIGPPGAGKTVTAAKLAAEAVLNSRPAQLATADIVKTMGVEQLTSYAQKMKVKVARIDDSSKARMLADGVASRRLPGLTVLDTAGINPFDSGERASLEDILFTANAQPVLVMPAGIDPYEAEDMARAFAELGARQLIVTRVDSARRLASVITAARAGRLALAGLGQSPFVADGLETATPHLFARLLADLDRGRAPRPQFAPERKAQ